MEPLPNLAGVEFVDDFFTSEANVRRPFLHRRGGYSKSDEAKKPKQANATTAPRTRVGKKSETTKAAIKPAKKVGAKKKKSIPTEPRSIKSAAAKKAKKTIA